VNAISKRSLSPLACAAAAAVLWAGATAAVACGEIFRGDIVTADREVGATPSGEAATFHVLGAGWFRAAEVVKHGGNSDKTYVTLELDGEPVITASFADLKNPWMELNTPFIVVNVRAIGDTSTMTIWYSPELKFSAMAVLRINVEEDGVDSLKMRTVMNKPAPHEHIAGQIGAVAALPTFK
jgi:hypothetical protein